MTRTFRRLSSISLPSGSAPRSSPPTTNSSRQRKSDQARAAGLARGRVHRARQVDGRLGDAPAARRRAVGRRARLVHHPSRRSRASCAASTSRRPSSQATIPEACAIDVCDLPGLPTVRDVGTAAWRELLAADRAQRRLAQPDCRSTQTRRRRTCGFGFFRTAAWRGFACTATSSPTGRGCGDAATSIWRQPSTAASSSAAATCSTARATT